MDIAKNYAERRGQSAYLFLGQCALLFDSPLKGDAGDEFHGEPGGIVLKVCSQQCRSVRPLGPLHGLQFAAHAGAK
jgi:hypothetical protein